MAYQIWFRGRPSPCLNYLLIGLLIEREYLVRVSHEHILLGGLAGKRLKLGLGPLGRFNLQPLLVLLHLVQLKVDL